MKSIQWVCIDAYILFEFTEGRDNGSTGLDGVACDNKTKQGLNNTEDRLASRITEV